MVLKPVNSDIVNKCIEWPEGPGHDPADPSKCVRCGAQLCDICMADDHRTSEGHDLNDPRYWGV